MLQELLLGLSGHATLLFDDTAAEAFPLITPAEASLLQTCSHLASLHKALRSHLAGIESDHPSPICRAAATSIRQVHLNRFATAIVDTERDILMKSAELVGAYDIVPLASIVSRFAPWRRRLEWYWMLACFMAPAEEAPLSDPVETGRRPCSGPSLLNRLRQEVKTGFPDLGVVSLELLSVVEKVWTRQLSQWILLGEVTGSHLCDFFVQTDMEEATSFHMVADSLLPEFVTEDTSASILLLGKTMHLLNSSSPSLAESISIHARSNENQESLKAVYVRQLQSLLELPSPFAASSVSAIISQMRTSLAEEVVDKFLPVDTFMSVLRMIREFFLAGRGEFMDALVAEADGSLTSRHRQSRYRADGMDLSSILMKESEVRAVLSRTWTALSSSIGRCDLTEESLDWAHKYIVLTLHPTSSARGVRGRSRMPQISDKFGDFLLLTATRLTLSLDSTFEIFLSDDHIAAYSAISSYLMAIRRGHNHLADMWRETTLRKDRPRPSRLRRSKSSLKLKEANGGRERFVKRVTWTTASSAVTLLAELGNVLTEEAIKHSWHSFELWALRPAAVMDSEQWHNASPESSLPRDPDMLVAAHRQYLATLLEMVLLTDDSFTTALRSTLMAIEQLVGAMKTAHLTLQDLDLRDASSLEEEGPKYAQTEAAVSENLRIATDSLNTRTLRLMESLQRASSTLKTRPRHLDSATGFLPYQDVSIFDRLLVRLATRPWE